MSEEEQAKPKHGRHSKSEELPGYMKRSRRMRRILIVVIVVLLLLLAAGGVLTYMLLDTARTAATQQTLTTEHDVDSIGSDEAAKDASTSTTKKTTVPNLVTILGLTQDQAVQQLQHGAQVVGVTEVNEAGNPIKTQVKVALTAEPSDARSGTPTVYLNLNEAGTIVESGYSVATSSIGYGSVSFIDAVQNEHVIENTLGEAGLVVEEGSAVLPENRMDYSTYASDGTTLTREYCSFNGTGQTDGVMHNWSAALSYDYSMANATGNLADTIRTVYIYVDAAYSP